MDPRQPYIDTLNTAMPAAQWVACALDRCRIRSLAFEGIQIVLGHDLAPVLTIMRQTYYLPTEPEPLAVTVLRCIRQHTDHITYAARILHRILQ